MGRRIEGPQHNDGRTDVTIPSKQYSQSGTTLEPLDVPPVAFRQSPGAAVLVTVRVTVRHVLAL
jgi:hypothetical protein